MADAIAVLDMGVVAQVGGPRTLYERPASRFVADFLGETNFLPAEITARGEGELTLATAAGEVRSTAFDAEATPGKGNVTCSIRPEAWKFSSGADARAGEGVLAGVLDESIYLGEVAQHIVRLAGDTRVKVFELHPARPIPVGAPVTLGVDPRDVVVLRD